MARLGQIVKLLNIGIGTAADFLQKKGESVEENLNTKLSKNQEEMLLAEFGTPDLLASLQKGKGRKEDRHAEKSDNDKEEKKVEVKQEKHYTDTVDRPQIKIVAKVDLDNLQKTVVKEDKPVVIPEEKQKEKPNEEVVSVVDEQSAEKPVVVSQTENKEPNKEVQTEKKEDHAKPERETKDMIEKKEDPVKDEEPKARKEEKKEEIFKLHAPELGSNIKVIDKIDLSVINNSTRPPKKSKEEKRKERIAKERQQMRDTAARSTANTDNVRKQQHSGTGTAVFTTETPKLQGPNIVDKIELPGNGHDKKKRKRIGGGEKIDVNKAVQNSGQPNGFRDGGRNNRKGKGNQKPVHTPVINEEDVARQVKETLARLTEGNKGVKKGAKYRKEKREAVAQRIQAEHEMEQAEAKILKLTEFVTANELAAMMNVPVNQVIQTCFNLGLFVSINQRLDAETINIVADEFGFKTEFVSADVVNAIHEEADNEEDLLPRSPIVTVMGHVDHGKTSLLDYIRKTNVIAGEAGGITQHIGAYNVTLDDGRHITFLDTPGHEAFTAMRARGAKVTDIAIIIVAADDDVMPQTVEAINHASAAGVPIVFAINKIDKPAANPDKIKEALSAMNYLVEEWGGKYQSQDISAKKGIGVNELLEKVLLEAEMLDLKANPNRKATGSVIESSLDKGRGYVATVLVSNGTLRVGDVMLAGTAYGRVKAMFNERNQRIKEAGPSDPVIVLGLNGAPQAGDNFNVFDQDHEAREIANKREQLAREQGLRTSKHLTLDEIGRRIALGNFQELNLIVKGDVDGSIEALSDSLLKLSTDEIQVNVIHKAVGQISESDVMLATASNAIIVGFQVRPSLEARKAAEREGVDIRLYSIIYDAIEEIKSAMEGMLAPEIKEEITATLEIRETFKITKVGTVAGCMVKEGKIKRTNKIRLIRDGIVIYSGELASLKRMKDDVKEVAFGYECGLNIANYNDIRIGDIIESYEEVEVKKTL